MSRSTHSKTSNIQSNRPVIDYISIHEILHSGVPRFQTKLWLGLGFEALSLKYMFSLRPFRHPYSQLDKRLFTNATPFTQTLHYRSDH